MSKIKIARELVKMAKELTADSGDNVGDLDFSLNLKWKYKTLKSEGNSTFIRFLNGVKAEVNDGKIKITRPIQTGFFPLKKINSAMESLQKFMDIVGYK